MANPARLFGGGRIFTADSDRPWADALLVDGDEVVAEAGRLGAECFEIGDGLLLPGFVDGHATPVAVNRRRA